MLNAVICMNERFAVENCGISCVTSKFTFKNNNAAHKTWLKYLTRNWVWPSLAAPEILICW